MKTTEDHTRPTQRAIQQARDEGDDRAATHAPAADAGLPAVQAEARKQPDRMPAQHLRKPGLESELALKPRFAAPDYRGSAKLQDFAALITSADSGIGRAVAVLFSREGAE